MNLEYLKTFEEVIKAGSFSDVAKKLSISQPAVSFQIQKLEQEFGIRLFDRKQKKLVTTEAGKRLLAFARLLDKEYHALASDFEHLREEVTGNLIVAASTIPNDFILPPLMSEFKKQHLKVNIQVEVMDSTKVIESVKNGTYDIGFCGVAPENHELESVEFAEDEIVLIAFPDHPFARLKKVSFADVCAESLILREPTSGTQRSLAKLLMNAGYDLNKCNVTLVLSTSESVVTAVEARSGIAFVSNLAIKKSVALGLVKVIAVEDIALKRSFWAIFRKQLAQSRLLGEFITFVKNI